MATITGTSGNDSLNGTVDADTIFGLAGDDTILGGDGNDRIDGGIGNDSLNGGTGINTVDYSGSATLVNVNLLTGLATGGYGADTLVNFQNIIGSALGDSLTGNTGNNVLTGGGGADTLTGGDGIDTADYTAATAAVVVNLTLGTGRFNVAEGDLLIGIENLTGSGFNDSLTGDTGNNLLLGLAGNDSLLGGDGSDTMDGGAGSADSMTGGNGDDLYYVDSTTDKISETSTGGLDLVNSSANYSLSFYVENLTLTGTANLNGSGNSSANTITGNTGDNSLAGGSGNDSLIGGAGNDKLNGESGIDTMTGGAGDDAYYIDNAADQVVEVANEGTDTVNSTMAWTLGAEFENLTLIGTTGVAGTGNAKGNIINGNVGSNLLSGLGGNDSIVADVPSDTLHGGNDTLDGGDGQNTLVGGLGNDTYLVTTGTDTIVEALNAGTDVVNSAISMTLVDNVENLVLGGVTDLTGTGNGLANVITGNTGANVLSGAAGADALNGGIGNDTLYGGAGVDSMVGGAGDDDYYVDDSADKTIELASAGTDQVFASVSFTLTADLEEIYADGLNAINLTGNTLNNLIVGNASVNLLSGSTGADTLIGNAGNDTLNGGAGVDSMVGGADNDTYIVDTALDLTIEGLGAGTDTVLTTINWTLADNLEALTLGGTSGLIGTGNILANTITGNIGANLLAGLGGADTLIGNDGADTMDGGTGNDSMVGGLGNDTYMIDNIADVIVEGLNEGTDLVKAGFDFVLGDNFDNLTMTGTTAVNGTGNALANVLTGNGIANVLSGLDGADTLLGGIGADTLDGGTGADSMAGGTGADVYTVDNVGDLVVETSATQIDTVNASVSFTLGTYVENLQLLAGAVNGTGNSGANTVTGNDASNLLIGLGGNDTMSGGLGADTLNGGTGDDALTGGDGNDVYIVNSQRDAVIEAGTTGVDRVESNASYILGADVENLTLTGANLINGTGNTVANVIIGNAAVNKIEGLNGADTLTGGDGADRFVFNSLGMGVDTITDFNGLVSGIADGDKLQLAASLLVGTFTYIGTDGFSNTGSTEARYNGSGKIVIDTNGDTIGDIFIALDGLTSATQISAADFVFL